MPYTGGTTFLLLSLAFRFTDGMCQCPTRAGLHFYAVRNNDKKKRHGVNALHGRDYISTLQNGNVSCAIIMCQCPTRAGLHFYPTSLRPSVYAGFKPLFFAHFSEYSDILAKQGVKVGKGRIVFFREQFSMFFIV